MSVQSCDICGQSRPISYIGRAKVCRDCEPALKAEIDAIRAEGKPVSAVAICADIRDSHRPPTIPRPGNALVGLFGTDSETYLCIGDRVYCVQSPDLGDRRYEQVGGLPEDAEEVTALADSEFWEELAKDFPELRA